MQSEQLRDQNKIETNRPAPLIPGFYSIQALSDDDSCPSVTQYHRKPEPAVRWKKGMVKKKLFDAFALCSSDSRWDVYDRKGKSLGTRTNIAPAGLFREVTTPVQVNLDDYVRSARDILGESACCLTWAEHHSHASSVGHSNMVVVARQMIIDASDDDLEHIYLVDSIASGCRVQGWFMDSAKVSPKLMDQYLDRFKWLSNGWPLANDHHIQVMAYRMATMRPLQLLEIMMVVGEMTPIGEHNGLIGLRVQQTPPDKLITFAARLFEGMEAAVLIKSPQSLEVMDPDVIATHAKRIAELYRETFL